MNKPVVGPADSKLLSVRITGGNSFGADPNILGRTITLDRRQHTVIGVLPPGFQFPIQTDPIDFYVTIAEDAANPDGSKPQTQERGSHSMEAIARLKPGVTIAQAQADLASNRGATLTAISRNEYFLRRASKPLREDMIGDVRTPLYVLFAAVVCVLLIANGNVANLLLARASARGKEMALRAAVGASRARIIRQLLTESILLSGLGGTLGLLIAQWGTEALIKTVPQNIPRISTIQLDAPVLAFTLLISLATGVIFGLVPAWQASHVDLIGSLKAGSRTGGGGEGKGRVRNALIMAEVALALVLLIAAGLLIQELCPPRSSSTWLTDRTFIDRSDRVAGYRLPKKREHHCFL
jgi:putative ABC transport system permease protein